MLSFLNIDWATIRSKTESGFRNDATPEDEINYILMVSKEKRGFFYVAVAVGALLWLIGSFL